MENNHIYCKLTDIFIFNILCSVFSGFWLMRRVPALMCDNEIHYSNTISHICIFQAAPLDTG